MRGQLDEPRPVKVMFRVHAFTEDLDVSWAKKLLGLVPSDESLVGLYADEHDGIAGCEFSIGSPLKTMEERSRWEHPVFRTATNWLTKKSPEDLQLLRGAGSHADILVVEYTGVIPLELLKEIVRLELDLVILGSP